MTPPQRRSGPLLALGALLCATALADSTRSRPAPAPGSSPAGARAEREIRDDGRGGVGWRRGPTGWSRLGIPWFRPLVPGPARTVRPPEPPDFADREQDLTASPEPVAGPPAELTFRIEPPTASVFLDDVWVGRGEGLAHPDARLEVRPGTHRLVVGDAGRRPRVLTLELEPGEERRIDVHLDVPRTSRP